MGGYNRKFIVIMSLSICLLCVACGKYKAKEKDISATVKVEEIKEKDTTTKVTVTEQETSKETVIEETLEENDKSKETTIEETLYE